MGRCFLDVAKEWERPFVIVEIERHRDRGAGNLFNNVLPRATPNHHVGYGKCEH